MSLHRDWPSYIYLLLLIANSVVIVSGPSWWILVPCILIQGGFFIGLLELTHQSVHRNFVKNRLMNEILGSIAASLIGYNLVGYRHFHLEHHRHTCDRNDPEGLLFQHSPGTRWLALVAPLEQVWLAFNINRVARRYVPPNKKQQWRVQGAVISAVMSSLALFAVVNPWAFLTVYVLPFCIFAWADFFFSQAEHYGVTIADEHKQAMVGEMSFDLTVPLWLSHLMLNRNLHAIHHIWPATRWFEVPQKLQRRRIEEPHRVLSLTQFLSLWWAQGPRMWSKDLVSD